MKLTMKMNEYNIAPISVTVCSQNVRTLSFLSSLLVAQEIRQVWQQETCVGSSVSDTFGRGKNVHTPTYIRIFFLFYFVNDALSAIGNCYLPIIVTKLLYNTASLMFSFSFFFIILLAALRRW